MSPSPRKEWSVPGMPDPISHYTHAVSLADLVFVSGFTASDGKGGVLGGDDVEAQTDHVLERLSQTLAAAGSSLQNVLRVVVYLTDIRDRGAVNVSRRRHFGDARPASTLIEVPHLATLGAKVEIEAVAYRPAPSA